MGPSGAGPASTAWLKGAVVYNSNSIFSDLKIGDAAKNGVSNGSGASNTSFTRCQFRGGGTVAYRAPMYFGGGTNSCDHITFTDCNIERNLGEAGSFASGWNNVLWLEDPSRRDGAHMEYITFTRCHFGVDNGRRDIARSIGSPRANVELYTWNGAAVRYGYHNVTFQDCIFEAADSFTIDIPCDDFNGVQTDSYVTLDGCTIYGGGVRSGFNFPDAIVIEGPNYVTVNDCDIYPARNVTLSTLDYNGFGCDNWQITNNRFHLDDYTHGGINARSSEPAIVLRGQGTFAGNTIHNSSGGYYLLWLGNYYDTPAGGLHDSTITGNHFHELRSTANPMGALWNVTNSTVTGNTFQTAAASGPSFDYSNSGNTGTTVKDNVFLHR